MLDQIHTAENAKKTANAADLPIGEGAHIPPPPSIQPSSWRGSAEEIAAKKSRRTSLITTPIVLLCGVGLIVWWNLDPVANAFVLIGGCALAGWAIGASIVIPFMMKTAKARFEETERGAQRVMLSMQNIDADPTRGTLLRLNRTEMERYHHLTIEQAARSFRHSQIAMYLGFGLLVFSIVIVVWPATSVQTKLTVAALGLVSTTVSGYITQTFLKSHAQSVAQLNRFFNQPLVSSYLLTAERLALSLEDSARNDALGLVIAAALNAANTERQLTEAFSRTKRRAPARAASTKSAEPVA